MLGGLAAAIAIIFFVTFHEAGHFVAAKAVGMKATEFFFGFGPRLWSTRKGETEYGIKAIPLGGYVRIVGMNPLEEVAASDMGRTYREKKFWEKSVVVLAGVGANFLLAFLMFYGLVLANGVPGDVTPVVGVVVEGAPAADAGLEPGDRIVAIDGNRIDDWESVPETLGEIGPGPATVTVERDGQTLDFALDLVASETVPGSGFLGVSPLREQLTVGPLQALGVSGQLVRQGIGDTFSSLYQMLRPSSLAQYFGVLLGNTDVPDEIRPVSPIGIVAIGSQVENLALFVAILAHVNVILATINLLPLFPLDGGHFAVALYEKVTGRQADIRRLMPVAATVIGIFAFLGFVAIVLDVANPINL
ncbi:MAG TPA: M50 family metallopeptidase [Acidimicrobiia bacterium]